MRDARDRALKAIGFAAAPRRSEMVALWLKDMREGARGIRLAMGSSKTDQEGTEQEIADPEGRRIHPAALVNAWLARAVIAQGFVFRRNRAVRRGRFL